MSLPSKGTRGRVLLDYLATVESQDIGGVIAALSESLTKNSIRNAIAEMYLRGHVDNLSIEQEGEPRRSAITDEVALTQATRYELEDAEDEVAIKANAAALVPPRQVNVLNTPPLNPSRFLKTTGTRPDSDWSQFKSRQL